MWSLVKQSFLTMRTKKYKNPVDAIDIPAPDVELTEPVEADKFDRHMRKARKSDMNARRRIFINQGNADSDRETRRSNIQSSVY